MKNSTIPQFHNARSAYLLAGPTASGKSAIAATLAREMGARILSADSMLVYKGMDIGTAKPPPEYPVIKIDRAIVRERIARRLDDMFMAGLEAEKAKLHELYPKWSRTAALAIGYREGDTREKIYVRTCQLAKRQDTWFRHQSTPIYVEPTIDSVRACWHLHGPSILNPIP